MSGKTATTFYFLWTGHLSIKKNYFALAHIINNRVEEYGFFIALWPR